MIWTEYQKRTSLTRTFGRNIRKLGMVPILKRLACHSLLDAKPFLGIANTNGSGRRILRKT